MAEGVLLASITLMGAFGFSVIVREMYRLGRLVESMPVERAMAGFLLLAVAQALSAASYLEDDERMAYSLYIGSSASSLVGYLLLLSSTRVERRLFLHTPVALLPALLDLGSLVGSALLAYRTGGAARAGFAMLAMSHLIRFLSLAYGGPPSLYLLIVGEIFRAASSASLALFYAGGLLWVGKKK